MKRIIYTLFLSSAMALSVPAAHAFKGGGGSGAGSGGGEADAEMSRSFRSETPRYGVPSQIGCCVKDASKHPEIKKRQLEIMNRGLLKDR